MRTIIALSMFIFALSSCKMNSTVPPKTNTPMPSIVGRWQLVQITGGITGHGKPMASQDEYITFNSDGTFISTATELFKTERGSYAISQKFSKYFNKDCLYLMLTHSNIGSINNVLTLSDGTMSLTCEYSDGYGYIFNRR